MTTVTDIRQKITQGQALMEKLWEQYFQVVATDIRDRDANDEILPIRSLAFLLGEGTTPQRARQMIYARKMSDHIVAAADGERGIKWELAKQILEQPRRTRKAPEAKITVVRALMDLPGMTLAKIGAAADLAPSTVSRIIAALKEGREASDIDEEGEDTPEAVPPVQEPSKAPVATPDVEEELRQALVEEAGGVEPTEEELWEATTPVAAVLAEQMVAQSEEVVMPDDPTLQPNHSVAEADILAELEDLDLSDL
jgi:hypothetical protein